MAQHVIPGIFFQNPERKEAVTQEINKNEVVKKRFLKEGGWRKKKLRDLKKERIFIKIQLLFGAIFDFPCEQFVTISII